MTDTKPNPPHTASDPSRVLAQLRRQLDAVALRLRLVLLLRGVLVCLSGAIIFILVIGMLDLLLRLPGSVRIVLLVGLLFTIMWLLRHRVIPVLTARLLPTDVALLIERREPAARGLLASAIDLASSCDAQDDTDAADRDALRLAALRTAARRIEGLKIAGVLRPGVLARPAGAMLVLLFVVLLIGVLHPVTLRVGVRRVLTPWDSTRWPVRYAIEDVTPREAKPVDSPVQIRALIGNVQSQLGDTTRAMVTWRLLDERGDAIGDWSRTLLMPQRKRDPVKDVPIYEQLIDVRDRAARLPDQQRFTLEYRMSTRDDVIGTRRVPLVRPPELRSTRIELQPPAYAMPIAERELVRAGTIASEKSDVVVTPVLQGTRVVMTWRFSKPIAWSAERPQWVQRLMETTGEVGLDQPDASSMRLAFVAQQTVLIEPAVRDLTGIPVRVPIAATLEVQEDLRPSVRIVEPARDEQVSARAVVELVAELNDDLGLTRAVLLAQRASPPEGSSGAPPEPVGERIMIADRPIDIEPKATMTQTLDLSSLTLQPGDELRVLASGWDLRAQERDPSMGRADSGIRLLRIVGQDELIEQIRNALNPLRGNLRQLDQRQGELQQMLRDGAPRTGDEQRSLSDRLRANQHAIEQLAQSVRRNRLDDPALASTLDDASAVLQEASEQSERAQDQISRGDTQSASQSQRRVRDRLGELLTTLDQGQDAWMAVRNVQRVRSELQSIRNDTQSLAQRTAAQSLDELSPDDRSTLERILERQLQNAEDARQAMNTLDQRAQELEGKDPTQAEALRRAASQARAAQLEQKLRDAGAQIERNQTGNATQSQDEVLEKLEELLEELENTIQNRDNALRRELGTIIKSIKSLINAQERELVRLDGAKLNNDFTNLDTHIIALVRNTLSVRDEALGAFPETRVIADHIGRAGSAQNGAISALRSTPTDADRAEQSQRGALQNLFNALQEAERLDKQAAQRQAQRAREELRKAYELALDTQSRIYDETIALGPDPLGRRERSQARSIGQRQTQLRDELSLLPQQTEGLSEAPMFTLAHSQLDRLMGLSTSGLDERQISALTTQSQRQTMQILSSLIEVLEEPKQSAQEDFDDGQSQGGGQSGGQGGGDEPLIPPVAELRLLRSMQQLVADQTRVMREASSTPDPAQVRAVGALQKQLFEQGAGLIERMNPPPRPTQPPIEPDDKDHDAGEPNRGPIEPVENNREREE